MPFVVAFSQVLALKEKAELGQWVLEDDIKPETYLLDSLAVSYVFHNVFLAQSPVVALHSQDSSRFDFAEYL